VEGTSVGIGEYEEWTEDVILKDPFVVNLIDRRVQKLRNHPDHKGLEVKLRAHLSDAWTAWVRLKSKQLRRGNKGSRTEPLTRTIPSQKQPDSEDAEPSQLPEHDPERPRFPAASGNNSLPPWCVDTLNTWISRGYVDAAGLRGYVSSLEHHDPPRPSTATPASLLLRTPTSAVQLSSRLSGLRDIVRTD
jgi:hypothetical protein